jgi:hypothetical protein
MTTRAHIIALAATSALLIAPTPSSLAARAHAPIVVVDANHSSNWGGYNQGALDHAPFHQIAGDWTVPTATQHTRGRAEHSSAWIGIGGGCVTDTCGAATDSTLIQTGTEQDVSAAGKATYSAWYELIPAPSLSISNVAVSPGDRMHAEITELVPGVWTITLKNTTKNQTFSTTVPYASTYGSAEWIVETPIVIGTDGTGFAAMPNLTPTQFTAARANNASAALAATQEMQLIDPTTGATIVDPSATTPDRTAFTACTYTTTC